MAPKVLLRLSSTAFAAGFVLALVAASSAVRHVGAGRPAPADDLPHALMRAAIMPPAAAAAKQQADQPATTTDGAGASGCSNNPNNSGGRCPHRHISSSNSSQTTD